MSIHSASPPSKRIKLESLSPSPVAENSRRTEDDSPRKDVTDEHEDPEHQCSICLQHILDRTVIPICSHEFCFECLVVWSEQSRRCPLCSQSIGGYLIHNIRSRYDFRKHFLTPLRTSLPPTLTRAQIAEPARRRRTARERERDRRLRDEREEVDKLQRSIEKRRWIYEHDLYAKHVASNSYTRYRPYPTPSQFAASAEFISRTTSFLRRELQVWDDLDVEFLTTFTISLMKAIDIRSESAIKLLAEFLDMDTPYSEGGRQVNAEHFAHEVYSYVRSPFRDLFVYDTVVQYDAPPSDAPDQRGRQSRDISRSRSRSRSHYVRPPSPAGRDRPASWSPSGRHYPSSSRVRLYGSAQRQRDRSGGPSHQRNLTLAGQVDQHHERKNTQRDRSLDQEYPTRGSSRGRTESSKGKERMDGQSNAIPGDTVSVPVTPKSKVANVIAMQGEPFSNSVPKSFRSEQKKPLRTRNLQESVQAHLNPGAVSRPGDIGARSEKVPLTTERHRNMTSSVHENSSAVPTSLAPLPNSKTVTTEQTASIPVSMPLISRDITDRHQASSASGNAGKMQSTGMSAPEIMARTRARMAKNYGNLSSNSFSTVQSKDVGISSSSPLDDRQGIPLPVSPQRALAMEDSARDSDHSMNKSSRPSGLGHDQKSQASTTARGNSTRNSAHSELSFHQVTRSSVANHPHQELKEPLNIQHVDRHMAMRGNPIDDHPLNSTSIDTESHASLSDIRTRLLARLEQEKQQAHSGDFVKASSLGVTSVDRTFLTGDSETRSLAPVASMDTSVADPQVMENKLRTRAQLQVRLAAEKRSGRV